MSTALELEPRYDELDLLPPIEDFLVLIDRIAAENPKTLGIVGGNILIHIRDVAVRTIVTSGLKKGIHKEPLDVEVGFALVCEEWVLLRLLDDSAKVDVQKLIDAGYLYLHGNADIWDKYLALGEQKSMLSVRASSSAPAASAASAPKKKALRRAAP